MGIAIVVVLGIVVVTIVAVVGDYLSKAKGSKSNIDVDVINNMEKRISELENKVIDQEKTILNMESDIKFTTKLLEDKHKD